VRLLVLLADLLVEGTAVEKGRDVEAVAEGGVALRGASPPTRGSRAAAGRHRRQLHSYGPLSRTNAPVML
jgi:hypothetical protein